VRLSLRPAGNRGQTPILFSRVGKSGSVRYFLALLACALLLAACSRAQVFHHEAYVFGTRVDVAVYGENQAEADLPRLAGVALQSKAVQSNPRPVREAGEIEALLREMW